MISKSLILSVLTRLFTFTRRSGIGGDFLDDFKVFGQCVKLGNKINRGPYHLVCHAPKSTDLALLKRLVNKLLRQSNKVIICFENLCGPESITFNSVKSFTNLFKAVTNQRVGNVP